MNYEVAHATLAELGRKSGRVFSNDLIVEAVKKLGKNATISSQWNFIDKYPKGHRDVLKNITTYHPARFQAAWKDGKTYMAFVRGHVLAIIDGVTHDWSNCRALRIHTIYEIN